MKKSDVIYDDNVDYDALEQHTYEDSGDDVFYTCPICCLLYTSPGHYH